MPLNNESHTRYAMAKINIGLYVTAKRDDGYHNLETVFYPIPLCDTLQVDPIDDSREYVLETAGYKIEGKSEDNLIVKVYKSLREEFGLPSVNIYLDKHIPMGAGLGGGSSDAAEMMKLLNEMFNIGLSDAEMEERLSNFGADCPFFVKKTPAFATGIGDMLTPIDFSLKGWVLVLIKPKTFVSTREAYSGIKPDKSDIDLREAVQLPVDSWKDMIRNVFETSVFALHPEIAAIKSTLYDMGATYASMSGSGSTVYALFRHKQEGLKRVFNDCFVYQSQLR